jgi:hypothetical protein
MPSRVVAARWIWYLYGAAFPCLVFGALLLGMRTLPLVAGVPLLAVVGLSAILVWTHARGPILISLGTSVLLVVLGVLLLGGQGTSIHSSGRDFVDPPGLPALLHVPALLLGVFLPPTLVFYFLRALRVSGAAGRQTSDDRLPA